MKGNFAFFFQFVFSLHLYSLFSRLTLLSLIAHMERWSRQSVKGGLIPVFFESRYDDKLAPTAS